MDSYALIILPPQEVIDFVDGYRRQFAKYTNYVIPPHFTIYPPFYSNYSSESKLKMQLKNGFSKTRPAKVILESIGYFEGKNNIAFFEPAAESSAYIVDLLILATKCLTGKVKNVYDDYNFTPTKFKPHMTIAEKIPSEVFPSIKEALSEIKTNQSFDLNSVYLYKQVSDSVIWTEVAKIDLGSQDH